MSDSIKPLNREIAELLIGVPLRFEEEDGETFIFRVGLDDDGIPYDTLADYEGNLNAVVEALPDDCKLYIAHKYDDGQYGASFIFKDVDGEEMQQYPHFGATRQQAAAKAFLAYLIWKAEQKSEDQKL